MHAYRYWGLFVVYLVDYSPEQFKYRHVIEISIDYFLWIPKYFNLRFSR